jgi:diacylglycerol kinase (ATP)
MRMKKPKYSIFKRLSYAFAGLAEITKHEKSFQLQLFFFVLMSFVAWTLPTTFFLHALLWLSLFFPIMAEIMNSAIERAVDLVTSEYNILAKYAKDAGAALVLVSIIFTGFVWIAVLLQVFLLA